MKRFLGHIVVLLFVCQASAQILAPMGKGLPEAPDKIAEYKSGIVVVYDNQYSDVELQVWNGDFWYTLEKPNLPKIGSSDNGNYTIVDLLTFNDEVYLATAYETKIEGITANSVSKWNGETWSDITTDLIGDSKSLTKLFIENNRLKCVGKFTSGLDRYNILKLDNGTWEPEGNLITSNIDNDNFTSIAYNNNKLFATGNFTNPTSNNISLAVWDGTEWAAANFPPFLGKNIALGNYQDHVVIFGKSDFDTESIKISVGENWQNLSNGLENYTVDNVKQFAEVGNNLFAVGRFTDNTTNSISNLMMYDGDTWTTTKLNLSDIEQLYSWEENVLVSGDFYDNARLNGIGTIYTDRAQITARVYNDENGNCTKDQNEAWIPSYPIQLKGQKNHFYTDLSGQLYLQVNKNQHTINASEFNYYVPTCPDLDLDVQEYKTYYGAALGVKQQIGINDAALYISDHQSYKALLDENKTAQLCLENKGTEPIFNAKVTLQLGDGISNFKSSVPFDTYVGNMVTWILDAAKNTSNCFSITYTITSEENISLTANVKLSNGSEDNYIANNNSRLQYKKGETLENTKHCANGSIIDPSTEMMTYKIGYKNTSSRTAIAVKIVDLLDKDLILTTRGFQYGTTIYPNATVTTEHELILIGDNIWRDKLITTIENVSIPPSSIDNEASSGFVDYYLAMDPVPKGTEICNTAKIHFSNRIGSYEEPIITDTVCSVVGETVSVVNSTGLPENASDLTIGPNPVKDFIHFQNKGLEKYSILVLNALGQTVREIKINPLSTNELDVRSLESGVYFVYSNGIFAKKFVLTK
ncbi:MAG: hypothetical protein COA58_16600 [Bacteroidetes bacterium]|nr:MAG: hypothetical protein COA58_16600 [Bacteroidota bacterium]